ncbi:MAG TPA: tetratricopeptide repeat protein [Usitatibacteraceae bacterium]|nr:tetratricopeptide repeat protein [Usitatibacteraceae bacterium]
MSAISEEQRKLYQSAIQHQQAGRLADAENTYRALLGFAPHVWQAWYNLALLLQARGAHAEAVDAYRQALTINPQFAEAHNNLGNALRATGRKAEAIESFRRALHRNPGLAQASFNLGSMFQEAGQWGSAIAALRQSVAHDPRNPAAWEALWRVQIAAGRPDDACRTFLQWEASAPLTPELIAAGLHSSRPLADRVREARYVRQALEWPFAAAKPSQLSAILGLLQYFDVSGANLLDVYRRYDQAVAAYAPAALPVAGRAGDGRIRIGYVSGDFRRHVMGRLVWEVISRHDRTRFSIVLFSLAGLTMHDDWTERMRSASDGFHELAALDDAAAARCIAEAGIDVLVDLGGHTMSARPEMYSSRPARHLVTHLGYHGSLGLSFADGKISDHVADPPGNEAFQLEPPLRIDACVFPLAACVPDAAPPLDPPPGLDGKFVFAAFVNVLKLSPRCLAAWKQVLDRAPNAVLLFSPFVRADQNALRAMCAAAGIDATRFAFLELDARDPRLAQRYALCHAAMDTFPYAGGDTTLAALAMGVPVVTLAGLRHGERMGASILTHLGMPELVTTHVDRFVDVAAALASDRNFLETMQEKVRKAMADSPAHLTRHTRALESVFETLARRPAISTAPTSHGASPRG